MTPQEQAFREIDRTVESLDRLIDDIERWQWQQRLEADPEAKAFHDAIRDLVEQKATDNYVSRVHARRLARVTEAEKRFGWGDR